MAWIIGLATDEEIEALQGRGYEVTAPDEATRLGLCVMDPDEIVAEHTIHFPGHPENKQEYRTRMRAIQVYVDMDVFQLLSSRGFTTRPDGCRNGDSLCLNYLLAERKPTVPDRLPTLNGLERVWERQQRLP